MWLSLFVLLGLSNLAVCILPAKACLLPPDLWCDSPVAAMTCTGTLKYCEQYKSNRRGRKLQLNLAFESACPDSQQCVVYQIYPKILSKPTISSMVDFNPVPWGLAKRETDQKVKCHHGEKECIGNRLLTCLFEIYTQDHYWRNRLFYCFMNNMMYKSPPRTSMMSCLNQFQIESGIKNRILTCANTTHSVELQKHDEIHTKQFFRGKFVPFVSLNGYGHVHMQAYQMMLKEKVPIWNDTVQAPLSVNKFPSSRCNLPPDFWCSDRAFSNECYNPAMCDLYTNTIYGKPLNFHIIFDSGLQESRNYVFVYIKSWFVRRTEFKNKAKIVLESVPQPKAADIYHEYAIQECVQHLVTDPNVRNEILLCILEAKVRTPTGDIRDAWNGRCYTHVPRLRDSVLICANSQQWRQLASQRDRLHAQLKPERKTTDPWLIINNWSMRAAQGYQPILHRMVCLWYRGNGHNRDDCARCEYEPTHCL